MAIGGPKRVALAIFIPTGITGHHFQHQVAQGIDQLDVGIGLKALWVILLGTSGGNIELLQLFRDAIMKQQCPSMPLHQSATSPSISSCSTPARVARRNIDWASSSGSALRFRPARSEDRRVGKGGVSTCRTR